jgi:rhamnulokinase
MSDPLALAAVDLGASSGRVVLGRIGPDTLDLTEVSRFRNGPVPLPDGLYWDALGLYLDVLDGIRAAERRSGGLAGLAVDSWGVDYGLLDADGMLLGNPRHYRDGRTAAVLDDVHRTLDPARLYELTGVQFLPFSTLYQLAAERRLEAGWQALLTPDLLGYWLTGVRAAEQTIASTTGLLDARTGDWAPEVVDGLGLPAGLLPDVVPPGRMLAGVTGPVRAELGLDHELLVSTVGSDRRCGAAVRTAGGGRAPRRRRCPQRAALPADRRRCSPAGAGRSGRGDRARQPAGAGPHPRRARWRPGRAAGQGPRRRAGGPVRAGHLSDPPDPPRPAGPGP